MRVARCTRAQDIARHNRLRIDKPSYTTFLSKIAVRGWCLTWAFGAVVILAVLAKGAGPAEAGEGDFWIFLVTGTVVAGALSAITSLAAGVATLVAAWIERAR